MRKKLLMIMLIIMVIFIVACSAKTDQEFSEANDEVIETTGQKEDLSIVGEDTLVLENNKVERYVDFFELTKSEIIDVMDEDAQYDETGSLVFKKMGVEISIGSIGVSSEVVTKITFTTKDIDFNGVNVGSSVEEFTNAFKNEIRSGENYKFFQYNEDLILRIEYNNSGEDRGIVTKTELMNPME